MPTAHVLSISLAAVRNRAASKRSPWLAVPALAGLAIGCDPTPPDLLIVTPFVDRAEVALPVGGSVERDLSVAAGATVEQGTAEAIVRHPSPTELALAVTSPAGTRVELGGFILEGRDYLRYAVPLLAVQGEPSDGTWRLSVRHAGPSGPGTLVVWAVQVGP